MFSPEHLEKVIDWPLAQQRRHICALASHALRDINDLCARGDIAAKKLSWSEVKEIAEDMGAVWDAWLETERAPNVRQVPASLDEKTTVENLSILLAWRKSVMANVLSRVMTERLLIEIRFVRAGLGGSRPAAVPRGNYF